MRTLSTEEVTALIDWAKENHSKNWGVWSDYPLTGCTFLQYDNNRLIVKFDEAASFGSLKFKRIGWDRRMPGKEAAITFSALAYELFNR